MSGTTPPIENGIAVENVDYNLLDLDTWRSEILFHPWHFWQWSNQRVPVTSSTNDLLRSYAWQDYDALSRENIRSGIINAETRLFEQLGYWPAPKYREVTIEWPQYPKADLINTSYVAPDGRWVGVRLPESYIKSLGIEALTEIDAEAIVTYTDETGDGLWDTFAVVVLTADYSPKDIAVYFSSTDRINDEEPNEKWRIRPTRISVDETAETTTIRGPAWIMARPILYEGIVNDALDPENSDNYVSTVEVYRRYTYSGGTTLATAHAVLVWENFPHPEWCASASGSDPSALGYAFARAVIRDPVNGIIGISQSAYSETSGTWTAVNFDSVRPPDRVVVRYLAGYEADYQNNMQARMRYMVSRLSAAEIQHRTKARSEAHRQLYNWQEDLSRSTGQDTYGFISREDLNNPFGTRRGAVMAWKEVKANRNLRGFSV